MQGLAEPKYGPQKCTSENALLALQSKFGYSFKSAAAGSGVNGVRNSRYGLKEYNMEHIDKKYHNSSENVK